MSNAPRKQAGASRNVAKPKSKQPAKPAAPNTELRVRLKQQRKQLRAAAPAGDDAYKRQLKKLLSAFLDPYDSEPQRLALGGGRPTAVNRLYRKTTAGVPSVTTSGDQYVSGATFKAVFRHPVLSEIEYLPNAVNLDYQWQFPSGGTIVSSFPVGETDPIIIATATPNATAAHGLYQPVIRDAEGTTRLWIDVEPLTAPGSNSFIELTNLTAGASYTIRFSRLINDTITDYDITTGALPGTTFKWFLPLGGSGYWTIQTLNQPALPVGFRVHHVSTCAVFAHRSLPSLHTNWADINAMRVTAVSALYSDRTSQLITQGNITSAQVGASEHWTTHAGIGPGLCAGGVDPYPVIAAYNGCYSGPYRKGAYRPLKPASLEELNLIPMDTCDANYPPAVDLDALGDYIVVAVSTGTLTTGVIAEFTATWHVEFETESQWRDLRAPDIHPRVLEDAQFLLAQANTGMENPLHLASVWNFIKKAAGVIGTVGGALAPMAGAYAPAVRMGSALATGVSQL